MLSIQQLQLTRPIIQAPMAGVQGSELAIAVSQAGGLGSLPCAMLSLEQMQQELSAIRAATDRPVNVNFFCHQPAQPSTEQQAAWLALLAPYYAELGLDPTTNLAAPVRLPFNAAMAEVLAPFAPAVVSFHFGLPSPELVARVKSWGSLIFASATTVEEGLWLQAHGADAVIAQGLEAGGHRGMFLSHDISTQVGTLALLPQLVDALDIPVIAAGGIADARGVAAALSLGAVAAQVGTAYLLCPEAHTSPLHRAALQQPSARHTALTNLFTGRPARSIVNRLMQDLAYLHPSAPVFPWAGAAVAPLKQAAEIQGTTDFSSLWCGQNTSGCSPIPAAELTRRLAGEKH